MSRIGVFLLAIICLSTVPAATAQIPRTLNFQGYMSSTPNGNATGYSGPMIFSLYTDPIGGSALWTETNPSVTVTNGLFRVTLGKLALLTLSFNQPYFLGIKVGNDSEMIPRQALTASPYAIRAASADRYQLPAETAACIGALEGTLRFQGVGSVEVCASGTWTPLNSRRIFSTSGLSGDATSSGYLLDRTLLFQKQLPGSRLRVSWTDNLRAYNASGSGVCTWEIHLDNTATGLKSSVYSMPNTYSYLPSTLVGYLDGIGIGTHNLKVFVLLPGATNASQCYTGWETSYLLEVEEIVTAP